MLRLVLGLAGRGHEIMVAAMLGGGRVEDRLLEAGVPVVSLRRRLPASGPVPNGLVSFVSRSRAFRPQLIMGWMYHGMCLASLLRAGAGIRAPIAWNVRCTLDDSQSLPASTRLLIRGLRAVSGRTASIVYNSALGRDQHAAYGFADSQGTVIGNGIDTDEFRPDRSQRDAVRKEFGIPADSLVIGHVARFHPQKGQLDLLAALSRTRLPPDSVVMMVGRDVTPDNRAIAAALGRLPVGLRVVLPGERSDVAAIMSAFDVYCLSSTTEGFPNVVAEAMACGIPCVVTDVGDAARMVGRSGLVVPKGDPDALAGALGALAMEAEADRTQRSRLARQIAEAEFSLGGMVERYEGLFEAICRR